MFCMQPPACAQPCACPPVAGALGFVVAGGEYGRQRWLDLIFGLTDGWWKFNDHDIRPSHPLVTRRTWLSLLSEAGYQGAVAIPGEAERKDSPQTILIAQAPPATADASTENPEFGWLVLADQTGVAKGPFHVSSVRSDSSAFGDTGL